MTEPDDLMQKNDTVHFTWKPLALLFLAGLSFLAGVLYEKDQAERNPPPPPPAESAPAPVPSPVSEAADKPEDLINLRAEFRPQSALVIGANELIPLYPSIFKDLITALHGRVQVIGIISNDEQLRAGKELLREVGLPPHAVRFLRFPINTMWIRDFGPFFVRYQDGTIKVVDTDYSAVDDKERWLDDDLPIMIGNTLGLEVTSLPLRMEGGNLMFNGDGICVTSTTLPNRNRQRKYSLEQIYGILNKHFGFTTWIYLRELNDEPTGHVDMYMKFLQPNLVVVGEMDPAEDPVNSALLDDAAKTLAENDTSLGPLVVERIPMLPPLNGNWRSYLNSIIVNGAILVPTFSDADPAVEKKALDTYRRLMPSWEIIPIPSDELIEKRGALHCLSFGIPQYVDISGLLEICE